MSKVKLVIKVKLRCDSCSSDSKLKLPANEVYGGFDKYGEETTFIEFNCTTCNEHYTYDIENGILKND